MLGKIIQRCIIYTWYQSIILSCNLCSHLHLISALQLTARQRIRRRLDHDRHHDDANAPRVRANGARGQRAVYRPERVFDRQRQETEPSIPAVGGGPGGGIGRGECRFVDGG